QLACGPIAGPVVDEDQFIAALARQRLRDLARERSHIAGLILDRHDDGKRHRLAHCPQRLFRAGRAPYTDASARETALRRIRARVQERVMPGHLISVVRRRPLAALLLLCVLAWLPGFFTLPPLDRDESRFAQATKQMLETGDFVDINLGSQARYAKPIGIYWLQAASTSVLGQGVRNHIWT